MKEYHKFKTPTTNTTGVKGVSPYRKNGKLKGYRASITVNGVFYCSSIFDTIEEAAMARKQLEKTYLK